jgi:hypothetical protein
LAIVGGVILFVLIGLIVKTTPDPDKSTGLEIVGTVAAGFFWLGCSRIWRYLRSWPPWLSLRSLVRDAWDWHGE